MNNIDKAPASHNLNSNLTRLSYNEIFYIDFPKKFERKFVDSIDKRFAVIWLITFVVHFTLAFYYSKKPIVSEYKPSEIHQIQKQFAQLVLQKEIVEEPEKVESSAIIVPEKKESENIEQDNFKQEDSGVSLPGEGKSAKVKGEKVAVAKPNYLNRIDYLIDADQKKYSATKKRKSVERASQVVSNKGILGLLTSSSSKAAGDEVLDIVGGAAKAQSELNQVLNKVAGIQQDRGGSLKGENAGTGSRNLKGNRAAGETDINNLIHEKEQAASSNIQRLGQLEKQKESSLKQDQAVLIGKRDPDEISAVVNRHNAAIQSCYQRELRRNPNLKGKLVVRFTIAPSGRVKDVQLISSTLNSPRVERCVISRIRRWDDFGAIDSSLGDTSFRQVYTFGY